MSTYERMTGQLRGGPRTWLITGVAGFIGSNLLETLLGLEQRVVGLDNLASGHRRNLDEVRAAVTADQWKRFRFVEGDIADLAACQSAVAGVELVLHQAALGSVPKSMSDPLGCHRSNVTGFLNVLTAARDAGARRVVYASSSAVYGDDRATSKSEAAIGRPLSPYAASKRMNEIYAEAFSQAYGFESIGLRYFNVFGPRQDPEGDYAAVIPKWITAMLRKETVFINGDGETSRDFCFIANVVQANLLAALTENREALNRVFNVALGERTTLNQLFAVLREHVAREDASVAEIKPGYRDFRAGDIRHSLAKIELAQRLLGYQPTHNLTQGIQEAMAWYRRQVAR